MTDPQLPLPARTLSSVFDDIADRRGHATAITDEYNSVSYRELRTLSDSAARSLISLGAQPGDHVACLVPNRIEWVVSFLAAAKVGCPFVPINTWYKKAEIEWTLRHTGATILLSVAEFLGHGYLEDIEEIEPAVRTATAGEIHGNALPQLRTIVGLGPRRHASYGWDEFLALGAAVGDADLKLRQRAVSASDPLVVLYTSGSTAEPKGVVLPHGGVVANGYAIGDRRNITSTDRIWLGSPLFYGLGATNALPVMLTRGATLLLQDRFDEETALAMIESQQATVFYGMSNMIRRIFTAPGFSRRRIESMTKGTAGIEPAERRLLIVEMGVSEATASYGSTEVCGNCLGGYPGDALDLKLETCGTLLPGFEAIVVDPVTGHLLAPGEVGLLKVRGNTALGYLHNEAETANVFGTDGFYTTGDLGAFGADGYFRYHARMKEMIKTGGINVSPAEIETLLTRHPGISEAYVVGIPDDDRGEAIVSFVVATESLSEADVQRHVRSIAANFKSPARVLFRSRDEVPRTASGKVPRQELRAEAVRAIEG